MSRFGTGRYAAIGFVVSKLVLPVVRKRLKRKARGTAANTTRASARAVKGNPGKTSLAVGSLVGAAGYLLKRRRSTSDDAADATPGKRARRRPKTGAKAASSRTRKPRD